MRSLSTGDIAPRFVCKDHNAKEFDLWGDNISGKRLGLVFCNGSLVRANAGLAQLARRYERIRELGADIVVISPDAVAANLELRQRLELPFSVVSDVDGNILDAYAALISTHERQGAMPVVLLRSNGHVLGTVACEEGCEAVLQLLEQDWRAQNSVGVHPPVLVVPEVLSRNDCERLIKLYVQSDAPLVPLSCLKDLKHDVKARVPDYGRRDRIDHMIGSSETLNFVAGLFQARLLPEIKKAFQYNVASFEALRIACYEGQRGGAAHGHRDNSLPALAHRRFAVSINLNGEDFEGGELHFPEYGERKYKPETGAAIVFSCSILHQALEVRHGKRYVLLTFLF